jgi:hypothetical protein
MVIVFGDDISYAAPFRCRFCGSRQANTGEGPFEADDPVCERANQGGAGHSNCGMLSFDFGTRGKRSVWRTERQARGTKVWFYRQQVMGLNSFVARLSETRNNGEKVPFIVTKAHGAGNNT